MFDGFLDRFFFFRRKNIYSNELKLIYKKNYYRLNKILKFSPRNKSYFIKALTHSSFLELHHGSLKSNQRLEFLGDSVLNLSVAKYLFNNYPGQEEGFLTKIRATLVNRERLYKTADELGLKDIIMYNQKYLGDSSEGIQTVMADCLEAIIGAIYLDRGLKAADNFIVKRIVIPNVGNKDFLVDTNYKGQLLEYTQAHKLRAPRYEVVSEEGPSHKKEFVINVYVESDLLGTGYGKNKKSAEQDASKSAVNKINAARNI